MWCSGDLDVLGSQRFNLKVEGSRPSEYIEKKCLKKKGVKGIVDPPKTTPLFFTTPHKIKSLFRQLMEIYQVRKKLPR